MPEIFAERRSLSTPSQWKPALPTFGRSACSAKETPRPSSRDWHGAPPSVALPDASIRISAGRANEQR